MPLDLLRPTSGPLVEGPSRASARPSGSRFCSRRSRRQEPPPSRPRSVFPASGTWHGSCWNIKCKQVACQHYVKSPPRRHKVREAGHPTVPPRLQPMSLPSHRMCLFGPSKPDPRLRVQEMRTRIFESAARARAPEPGSGQLHLSASGRPGWIFEVSRLVGP